MVGSTINVLEIKENIHQYAVSLFSINFLRCLSVKDRFQEKFEVLWSDLKLFTGLLHKLQGVMDMSVGIKGGLSVMLQKGYV